MWSRLLKNYRSEISGNIAVLSAIVLPVALILVGAAVDMSRLHSTSRFLQDTVDNVALAAISDPDLSELDQKLVAEESLRGLETELGFDIVVLSETVTLSDQGDTATVEVAVDVPQFFGGLLGQSSRRVVNTGVATRSGNGNVEPTSIVFVLDASGSMNAQFGSSTRIGVLKDTVQNIFANFDATVDAEARLRTGVYAYNWGIRDEHSNSLDNGWSTSVDRVNSLGLGNATIPTQALEVAVDDLISEHSTFGSEARRKVIVFMTDGEVDDHLNMNGRNSIYHPYNGGPGSFTERTVQACARAQDAGITVIAVSLGAPLEGRQVLQDCANAGAEPDSIFVNAVNAKKFEEALALAVPAQADGVVRLVR